MRALTCGMGPAALVVMRTFTTLAVVIAMTGPALADDRALSAADVQAALKPIGNEIERCYMDRTAEIQGAGHLALVLTVSKHGILENVAVKTPGLAPKLAKQIDGCVRREVAAVQFPSRHTETTATVPYFFQHTAAPGAGPQLSCWDPAGCHSK